MSKPKNNIIAVAMAKATCHKNVLTFGVSLDGSPGMGIVTDGEWNEKATADLAVAPLATNGDVAAAYEAIKSEARKAGRVVNVDARSERRFFSGELDIAD